MKARVLAIVLCANAAACGGETVSPIVSLGAP